MDEGWALDGTWGWSESEQNVVAAQENDRKACSKGSGWTKGHDRSARPAGKDGSKTGMQRTRRHSQ